MLTDGALLGKRIAYSGTALDVLGDSFHQVAKIFLNRELVVEALMVSRNLA